MQLSILDKKGVNPGVVLLQTPSTHLAIFLEDKLKRMAKCTMDTYIRVSTKTDLKNIKSFNTLYPPFGEKWFITVNLSDFDDKELVKVIAGSSTCLYFITCDKYIQYKKFKEALGKERVPEVYDFYINYLRRPDFLYLHDALVPEANRLTKQLFDFVIQGYSGDIDTLFKLWLEQAKGTKFENRKAITDFCGLGGLSVESIIFSLLKDISGSSKGLKKTISNRIRACTELGASLGYATLFKFLRKSLNTMIQLKCLMISSKVYKDVRNLPDCYDEKSLAKYQKYIWRLREIPLSRLLLLRQMLGNSVWRTELDIFQFVYSYYNNLAKQYLKGGNS